MDSVTLGLVVSFHFDDLRANGSQDDFMTHVLCNRVQCFDSRYPRLILVV
jgi:hypothetical protein